MIFVRVQLLRVLEEILPARFGGVGTDYQVVEEEVQHGILRLVLRISPLIGPLNEDAVRHVFLTELASEEELEGYTAKVWQAAGTIQIQRAAPLATKAGKILPFYPSTLIAISPVH
jgi:hypothetical protein